MTPAPLTVAEVATRRKVSTDTVLAWIHSGDLAATHEGTGKDRSTWRIEEADLAAFLEVRRNRKPDRKAPLRVRLPELANATRYFR